MIIRYERFVIGDIYWSGVRKNCNYGEIEGIEKQIDKVVAKICQAKIKESIGFKT